MQLLKQSTAATVLVGPVLDSAGASYASMVIGDFNITKNGTTAAMAAAATATHSHNGMYLIALTTGNTDTLDRLAISCNKATYAMTVFRFSVVSAVIYDSVIGGTDLLQVDVTQLLGTAWLTPGTAGTPDVNAKLWNGLTTVALPLIPTTAGRTLDVSATGEAGVDWANVGSQAATVALTATTVGTVSLIAANGINAASIADGAIDTATFASGTTIPRVTLADTVTTLTNLPAITANWVTAAGIAASALNGKGDWNTVTPSNLTAAQIATGVWTDTTAGDFTTALSVGKSLMNGVALGTGLTIGNVSGNVTGSVGSLAAQAKADVNAEVVDGLNVDTYAELAAPPAATSSLRDKLTWLFMWARNKSTETSTQRKLYADDTTTVVSTETVSDDATTFSKGEAA